MRQLKQILLCVFTIVFISSCKEEIKNKRIVGSVFGTSYSIQYSTNKDDSDFQEQFEKLFYIINKSMSTYQNNSIISKINRNEEIMIDSHFRKVFDLSSSFAEELDHNYIGIEHIFYILLVYEHSPLKFYFLQHHVLRLIYQNRISLQAL